jgi:hypothetical protein
MYNNALLVSYLVNPEQLTPFWFMPPQGTAKKVGFNVLFGAVRRMGKKTF